MSHQASDIITPKALLLDERLTPLERNAWLAFHSLTSSDGTVVLSYDALRKYLPSAPGSKRAALETVSRAVLCLRLSTWIALVGYRRNPMTGFSMASRYAVRNQPLTFDEACMEDEDYLPLLERALAHASATIRQLAQSILDETMRHPDRLDNLRSRSSLGMWNSRRSLRILSVTSSATKVGEVKMKSSSSIFSSSDFKAS